MGKPLGQFDDLDSTPRPVEVSTAPRHSNAAPAAPNAPVQHHRSNAKMAALAIIAAAIGSCSGGPDTLPASGSQSGAEAAEVVPQANPKLVAGLMENEDGTNAFTLYIKDLKKPTDFVVTPLDQPGAPVTVHYSGTKPAEMLSQEIGQVTKYSIEAFDSLSGQQIAIGTPKPDNGIEGPDHFGK